MQNETARRWLIKWLYGVAAVHLAVGILLPWIVNLPLFEAYHRSVETGFWTGGPPASARLQQALWISLFGPTIQTVALWMGALVYLGDRHRSAFAWGWLATGVLIWAPQDMLLSLRHGIWANVWIDVLSLIVIVPPLAWLWLHDRKTGALPS